jgi:hypothetical protein
MFHHTHPLPYLLTLLLSIFNLLSHLHILRLNRPHLVTLISLPILYLYLQVLHLFRQSLNSLPPILLPRTRAIYLIQ